MTEAHGTDNEKTKAEGHDVPKRAPKRASPLKGLLIGAGVSVLGVILITIGVFTFGIYKLGWQGPLADKVAGVIPYPAAYVNGNAISYADYWEDLGSLTTYYRGAAAAGQPVPSEEDMKKMVMEKLVRNVILEDEALRYGVQVTDEEIDAEFAKVIGEAGSVEQVKADLLSIYGMTIEEFKKKAIEPYLIELKLGEAMGKDEELNREAEAKATGILEQAKSGTDFGELAAQYSDDPGSGANGGDLGWFGRGAMVPEFEAAAFSLKKGEMSGLVKTQFGYHIILVDDIEEKDGAAERVKARHILVAGASADSLLQKAVDEAKVTSYVK